VTTPAVLALEDGTVFRGAGIGADGTATGEVVFNTAMTGYQEILTDPVLLPADRHADVSPHRQYRHQPRGPRVQLDPRGRPGHPRPAAAALELARHRVLQEFLKRPRRGDRRHRHPQAHANPAREGCAGRLHRGGDASIPARLAVEAARRFPGLKGMDLAKVVSDQAGLPVERGHQLGARAGPETPPGQRLHVVAYDFGIKRNILRLLADHGCRMTVVPAQTPADEALALKPDGVFLSNGPGDPEPCDYAIEPRSALPRGRRPGVRHLPRPPVAGPGQRARAP
jgi:carbamoyl-phosphate synthase small subunit